MDSIALPTEVYEHESDPPNPWAGYQRCLTDIPAGVSHLCVIQDDALVCPNFGPAVEQIAQSNPDVPVVLFLGGFPQGAARLFMRALLRKQPYINLLPSPIVPLVAVLWPKARAEEFLSWASGPVKLPGHPNPRADDGIAASWMKKTRQEVRVCVPSLVNHPDMVPSVKGGQKANWGTNRMRVALVVAADGLDHTW